MILLKNGKVIKNNNLIKKDILIDGDKIIKVEDNIDLDCKTLDCAGMLVMPGAIDVHVHLREPGFESKETIKTGTMAAAKGGVTTIMSMPNLNPVPDNYAALKKQLDIIEKDAVVKVYPYASVSVGQKDEIMANIDEVAPYVKAITDDGRGVNNIELLKSAMEHAKKHNLVIASHAEDNVYKYAPAGEYVAVRREIELAKQIGCKYHFCHMSTKESLEAIKKARDEGYTNITFEEAPHHLVFNKDMIKDANWKMNPPLREEIDRLATVDALVNGLCDVIASDHAPHTKEEKSKEYDKCPNGILGLETMMPIVITSFVKKGLITWDRFLDLMVYNPAKIFDLPYSKIEVGSVADIAVLDIDNLHKYSEDEIVSKSVNSPCIGMEFYGFTKYTLVNGNVVYERED